jgi:O-antigen ligase
MPASSTRDRFALVVLALGATAVVLVAATYKAFELDRYFVPKELVLHVSAVVATLAILGRSSRATLTLVDLLLFGFLVASTASAAAATNPWLAERALAISISGALLFWTAAALRRAGMVNALLVALAASVVIAAATSLAQAYGVETELFSVNRAPGGTFGNRNFIAHYVAIGTPVVVLVALTARRGLGSILGGVGVALLAAALVMSRSRGAWLAVVALTIVAGLLAFTTRDRWQTPTTVRRSVVLAAAAVAGAAAAVLLPNRLQWTSESPYLDSATGLVNYKEGSGHGRLVQYANSVRMTEAHLLLGVGPGNWAVVYPHYASRNDPSMSQDEGLTSNPWPSSDWVALLSERGVIALGLFVATVFALFVGAVRDFRPGRGGDGERALTAIALVGTVVAVAVVGAFDAVLLIAAPTFLFWTLAGALAPPPARAGRGIGGLRIWGTVAALVFGVVAITRSATELASMGDFSASTRVTSLASAARLDPGNYRIRVRLAQAYLSRGDCARAKSEARAARALLPNAAEPRRVLAACGSRS